MTKPLRPACAALSLALLAGCSQAPHYAPPDMALPATFREASSGPWVPAAPASPNPAAPWWQGFGDATLDDLETRLLAGNPSLAEAVARHDAALAEYGVARADTMPQVGVGAAVSANRQSDDRPLRGSNQPDTYGAQTLGGIATYQLDLWGQLGDRAKAARAHAEASADDVAFARLALTAQLADTYIALRGLDTETAILASAVKAYSDAATVTHHRFEKGIASGIDVGRADAQLADTQAQLAEVRGERAVTEHAIAALVGLPASSFDIPIEVQPLTALPIPALVPSGVLQARADIAAAERRMYAANREVGVARAAWFPAIGLGAGGGTQATALAGLFAAPNAFWSIGPQLVMPLFDGGRRHARQREAEAEWRAATAHYRGTVLAAMTQVEDALVRARRLSTEEAAEARAVHAASTAARLAYERYIKGVASMLEVVTAQTTELAVRRRAEAIHTQRLQIGVALREASGDVPPAPTPMLTPTPAN